MANEIIRGKDKILYFRRLAEQATDTGAKLAYQTNHEITYSRSNDTTPTKDGAINTVGGLETTISVQAILTRGGVSDILRDAVKTGEVVEVWEVDLGGGTGEGNTYPTLYGQGTFAEWTDPADVEEVSELDTEMAINGELQEGTVTLTEDDIAEIQYAFTDLDPHDGAGI